MFIILIKTLSFDSCLYEISVKLSIDQSMSRMISINISGTAVNIPPLLHHCERFISQFKKSKV